MNARVKKRDTLSKRQLQEIDALIREEYDRVADEHADGVTQRVVKLFCQVIYEEYRWSAKGFQRVIDRVVAIDASSSENHELMSHIDQNLDRLGYHFPHEDPEKWVVQ